MNATGIISIRILQCGTISPLGYGKTFPVYSYLIEHPAHGRILVDTGLSASGINLWPAYLRRLMNPCCDEESSAISRIQNLGIGPQDIDVLLITHLDADHISGLSDFVGKAKRIAVAEHEYFYSCRTVYKFKQPPKLWLQYSDSIERIYFTSVKLGPQGRGFDLFDDGSVICIHTPGHTEGQITVMVSNGRKLMPDGLHYSGSYILLGSDATFEPLTFDRKSQEKAKQWIDSACHDSDCIKVLLSHTFEKDNLIEF